MEGKYLLLFSSFTPFSQLEDAMSYQGQIGDVNTNGETVMWNIRPFFKNKNCLRITVVNHDSCQIIVCL